MQKYWVQDILRWFAGEQRILPWRARADNRVEPWQIWVSEIMLQQTTVATVTNRYLDFMKRWPTFPKLAQASEDDILHFWQGLGYYSRARNLYKAAQYIQQDLNGCFPKNLQDLKKIPGLGDYTAAAVAAIAFRQPVAAVDGNVARVLSRFWVMDDIGEILKKKQRERLLAYVPEQSGDFAQALIELGALICRPTKPKCTQCPLMPYCMAYAQKKVQNYPQKIIKKPKKIRQAQFYIIKNTKHEVLFFKRPAKGLLASMFVLPSNNWYEDDTLDIGQYIQDIEKQRCYEKSFKHIFTHIELRAEIYRLNTPYIRLNSAYWVKESDIDNLALPTVIKKAL